MTAPARTTLPDWPRLMPETLAAAYIGLSPTRLQAIGPAARVIGKRRLYDRHDLDRWADRLDNQPMDARAEQEEAAEIERRFLEKRHARG